MKKVLFVLSVLLVFAVTAANTATITATASENATQSGTWGQLSWEFEKSTGTLVISGNGEMQDINGNLVDAWKPYTEFIKTVIIEDGVTTVGDYAFAWCYNLESVTIPNGIISIGKHAFDSCQALTAISIPPSVTEIGEYAFYLLGGCDTFNVYISDLAAWCNVNFEDSFSNPLNSAVWGNLYVNNQLVTNLAIPQGVTRINSYAFYGCRGITCVQIPDSVAEIGNAAFLCSHLYVVCNHSDLPITFGSTEHGYLGYDAKLTIDKNGTPTYRNDNANIEYFHTSDGFLFEQQNGSYTLIAYFGTEEEVTLPNDANGLPYQIERMRGIRYAVLPNGMEQINENAFYSCPSLIGITIPKSVTDIGGCALAECPNLATITYLGTADQWETVTKGTNWDALSEGYAISYHEDHNWDFDGTINLPTHLREGSKSFTCLDCGAKKTESIPQTSAHTWSDYGNYNENQHQRTCPCGEIEYTDHVYDDQENTACDLCGYSKEIGTPAPEINTGDLTIEPSVDTDIHPTISDVEITIDTANVTVTPNINTNQNDLGFYVGCRSASACSAVFLLTVVLGAIGVLRKRKA